MRRWGRGCVFGGVVLGLPFDVCSHPFTVESVEESKEPFAVPKGIDALEPAVGFDFGVGEREVASHAGHRASAVEIGERFPNPVQVLGQDRFVREGLGLDALLFLNLTQPLGVSALGGRALRPIEVGYQFPSSLAAFSASNAASLDAMRMMSAKKPLSFGSDRSSVAASFENSISLPSRSLMPFQPLMMFSA